MAMKHGMIGLAALLMVPFAPVWAAGGTPAPVVHGRGGLNDADVAWLQTAARGDLFVEDAAGIALKTSQTNAVRHYAQGVMDGHGASDPRLQAVARRHEVLLPDKPDAAQQAVLGKLATLKGTAFDQAYIAAMRRANQRAVKSTDQEARVVKDRNLQTFLVKQRSVEQAEARKAAGLGGKAG